MLSDYSENEIRGLLANLLKIKPKDVILPRDITFRNTLTEDEVEIIAQFYEENSERNREVTIDWHPESEAELKAFIETCPHEDMLNMGLDVWCDYNTQFYYDNNIYLNDGEIHYLFPAEWYDYIPHGFPIITVAGTEEHFDKDIHFGDAIFGCLAYGFIKQC